MLVQIIIYLQKMTATISCCRASETTPTEICSHSINNTDILNRKSWAPAITQTIKNHQFTWKTTAFTNHSWNPLVIMQHVHPAPSQTVYIHLPLLVMMTPELPEKEIESTQPICILIPSEPRVPLIPFINKADSAIHITHIPGNFVIEMSRWSILT